MSSTKTKNKKRTVYDFITDQIIDALNEGVVPWRKTWDNAMGNPRSYDGRPYSGVNTLLTMLACWKNDWGNPVFITRNAAEKLGGGVKVGEAYTPVTLWIVRIPKEYADNPEDCPNNEKIWTLKFYKVYNIAQTTGLPPLPEISGSEDFEPLDECENIIYGMPDCPEFKQGGNQPCYVPKKDIVLMPPSGAFESQEGYYATLFHELVHATGHPKRLARFESDQADTPSDYAKEELIAEIGSSFLCARAGIANLAITENTGAYIKGWITKLKEDSRLIITAAKSATKAADYIFGE